MSMPRQLPAVAVSACLTGQAVRYDGGHRHQAELLDALADRLELLPLCPEFRLGIPRPPVQRVLTRQGQWRVLGRDDPRLDVTEILQREVDERIQRMQARPGFSGWILKSRSPSCGAGSTPLHGPDGQQTGLGDGLLAEALNQRCPWLVLAEETALTTPRQRQQFVRRCQWVHALLHGTLPLEQLHALGHTWHSQLSPATRQQLQSCLIHNRRRDYCQILVAHPSLSLPLPPGY